VKIVAAAREPGARSKIAVTSRDSDVDPVGACVGMRGARVQAVVQELRGEKIDIVPWDRDPARFVCNAIQPAEVSRVIIDEANGSMELVVPDDKLSLAIGRRGQNVRLASRLTSWRLDVISETKFEEREKLAIESLALIDGIDEGLAKSMYKLGFRTIEEVVEADSAELAAIPGFGSLETVQSIQAAAEAAMEAQRLQRIRTLSQSKDAITERDRMLLIQGMGERTIELLAEAGYKTLDSLSGDVDVDKLALNTGLGIRKAKQIAANVKQFRINEEQVFEEMREQARLDRELEEDIVADNSEVDSLSAGDWADTSLNEEGDDESSADNDVSDDEEEDANA
jgi:N utilization substance protein A